MENLLLERARILFVDDEAEVLSALKRITRKLDAECLFADSGGKGLELLELQQVDIVVSDMKMPEMDGVEFLSKVAMLYPETIRIVLTGFAEQHMMMNTINTGRVWGYLKKPWDNDDLLVTLNQALITRNLLLERLLLKRALEKYEHLSKPKFQGFVGESPEMQVVYHTIETIAPSNASVFITGKSGTGKEVAAEAIHQTSRRANKPFIALNCAAIPKNLMESEVFGHVKGAFSGAIQNRDGAAHMANGGTLFLDEIGEMDIALQPKLLRFIQTGTFQKVGSNKTEQVDIRFICATNRDPQKAIDHGQLREDLFYRLNVISIDMPNLDVRGWDIIMLADHFLQYYACEEDKLFTGFTEDAERLMIHYNWPGNVRQLQNTMNSVVILSAGPLVSSNDLIRMLKLDANTAADYMNRPLPYPQKVETKTNNSPADNVSDINSATESVPTATTDGQAALAAPVSNIASAQPIKALNIMEREIIESAIAQCDGSVVNAAKLLDVSPSTLYRKIEKWEHS